MEPIRAYYDGKIFVPIGPVSLGKNQQALIAVVNDPSTAMQPWRKHFGIMSAEACADIAEALRETEQVDQHEW